MATVLGGTTRSVGNFDVNTNKFTVAAATGNTVVAGTLTVSSSAVAAVAITGKARSASTVAADVGTTLVTKDYVDAAAGGVTLNDASLAADAVSGAISVKHSTTTPTTATDTTGIHVTYADASLGFLAAGGSKVTVHTLPDIMARP